MTRASLRLRDASTSARLAVRRHVRLAIAAGLLCTVRPQTTDACGWDYETYHAEAESLPCVHDATLGLWPRHTEEYDRARIDAFDTALSWAPHWTEALDAKALSQIRLGELEAAEQTLQHRLEVAPDAYGSHANLGTLYTFTGDWGRALQHIDRAMEIEPQAHFGREKVHRQLVAFMQRVAADPDVGKTENFLGITFEDDGRIKGSPEAFEAAGLGPQTFDALVSMITVYGGEGLPELYLALGEALSLHGDLRLAYTAYKRAEELGHPRKADLVRWQAAALEALEAARADNADGEYVGIDAAYRKTRREARRLRKTYARWERKAIRMGLAVWTRDGLDAIYTKMNESRPRCRAPAVIDGVKATTVVSGRPDEEGAK